MKHKDPYHEVKELAEGRYHYTTPALLRIGNDLAAALVSACGVDSDGILDAWENSYLLGCGIQFL